MRSLRQLMALAILANAALANANIFSDFLIQRPIGGVVLLDDGRHTSITTVVPLDKTLFAERNNRMPYAQEEIQSKLKTLSEGVHAQCAHLSRIESDDRQLPLAEFVRDNSKMDAESLDKVFGKYRRIFDALFKTANEKITLEKLSSQPAIGKAIRKVMEEMSTTKAVDKDIIVEAKGCTAEDKLILQITIPFVAEQHTVKLYEVVDAGRFVAGRVAYARIDMPRQWVNLATPETDAKWAVVDLEKCEEMQDGKKGCPDEAIMPTTECTPADVNGCPLDVKFIAEDTNFVEEFALSNGSYIIATNMQEFKRMLSEPKVERVPSSGVMLANVTGCRMAFGERKVPRALPNATSSEKTCGFMGLSTKPAMEFDDITFTDKPVDPTEWAFFLSLSTEEGMPTTAFIMARPAGFCYETMRFVAANMWWFIALVLMVSLSAMFTFFVVNRRISAETVRFIREKYGRGSVSSDDTSEDSLKTDMEGKKHRPIRNYFQAHLPTIKISGRKISRADTERVSGMSEERRHHFYQKLIDMIPMMPSGKHADVTDEEAPAPVALDMPIKEEETCLIQSEDETKPPKDTTPAAQIAPIVTKPTPITADSAIVKVGPVARDIPEMPTKKNIYKETIDKLLKRAAIMHAQPKPQANEMLVDIFAIAELLRHQTVADEDLQKFRDELLTKYHSKEDGNSDAMRMNLVDFLKLTQFGTEITREQYDEMPQKGISLEDCRRLQFALRGLRVHAFGRSYRFFNLAKQFPNTFCPPNQPEENKLTVAEMFKRQQGIVLRFPMLPMVRLANGSHPNAEAPMEMVQVVAKRELLFASIRLARLNSSLHKTYVETTKRVNAQLNKKKTFPKKKEEKPKEAAKPEAPKDEKKEVAE